MTSMNGTDAQEIQERLAYMVELLHRLVSMTADTLTALQLFIELLDLDSREEKSGAVDRD
jgi:hypothetical protein